MNSDFVEMDANGNPVKYAQDYDKLAFVRLLTNPALDTHETVMQLAAKYPHIFLEVGVVGADKPASAEPPKPEYIKVSIEGKEDTITVESYNKAIQKVIQAGWFDTVEGVPFPENFFNKFNKLRAIKMYSTLFGANLSEAKEKVELIIEQLDKR